MLGYSLNSDLITYSDQNIEKCIYFSNLGCSLGIAAKKGSLLCIDLKAYKSLLKYRQKQETYHQKIAKVRTDGLDQGCKTSNNNTGS